MALHVHTMALDMMMTLPESAHARVGFGRPLHTADR